MTTSDSSSPIDSQETARVRAQRRWLKRVYPIILVLFWGSLILGNVSIDIWNDSLVSYLLATALVTMPLVVSGYFVKRRLDRALSHGERRDRAAQQRSSAATVTAVAPLLYPTKPPDSADTARLRAQYRPFGRIVFPLLAIAIISELIVREGVGGDYPVIVFLVASVAVVIALVVSLFKVNRSSFVESQRRDLTTHRQSVIADAARTVVAPVLYLRSFGDDDRAATRHGALTEEEQLAKALAWIGPLLAVGRPGEQLPHVGAQRIYVDDADWQARVSELMSQARLVVFRTGSSESFRWEVAHALSTLRPEQLLLVVDSRRELRIVLDAIARHLDRPLGKVSLRGRSIGSVVGLVMFDSNWSLQPLRLVWGSLREKQADELLLARFTLALRPVFDRLGVHYAPPRFSRRRIFFLVYLIVLAIAIAIADWYEYD